MHRPQHQLLPGLATLAPAGSGRGYVLNGAGTAHSLPAGRSGAILAAAVAGDAVARNSAAATSTPASSTPAGGAAEHAAAAGGHGLQHFQSLRIVGTMAQEDGVHRLCLRELKVKDNTHTHTPGVALTFKCTLGTCVRLCSAEQGSLHWLCLRELHVGQRMRHT